MSIFSAKRRPYPYYLVVNGTGLLMGAPRPNQAVSLQNVRTQDINSIQPTDYSYAGLSPLNERDEPYESLVLGMGQKTQETWQDGRYRYARGVDLSVWPWCKGPAITTTAEAAGASSTGDGRFFELNGTLFRAQGNQIHKLNAGTGAWAMTKDFAAAGPIVAVYVFASNFDLQSRVFVGLQNGTAQWSTDGTAFTAMATLHAQAFVVIGREFWWADSINHLRKCDTNADPTNEANYTVAQFRIGDATSAITNLLVTAGGTLVVAKTDGLYTLDATGDDHPLYPFLRLAPEASNGKWSGQFLNSVYVSYGQNLLRINPDLSVDEVGLEKLVNNDSPVRGRVTAFVGLGVMFAYAAAWDPDSGLAHLLKFGSFPSQGLAQSPSVNQANVELKPTDAWHGSLSDPYSTKTIAHLHVSTIGAPSGHTRTWLSFSNGDIAWFTNPCVPNPAACSQYRYTVGDHWVELPEWNGTFPAVTKSLRQVLVTGEGFDANDYVQLEYRLSPTGSWTLMPDHFDQATVERVAFPTTAAAVQANFRVHLVNTANTAGPRVSSVVLGHAVRALRIMSFTADILCADGLVRRDGVPMRIGRKKIKELVEAAVDTAGAVVCVLPDETTQQLSFTDYQAVQSWDETGRSWRGSLRVTAVQWQHA